MWKTGITLPPHRDSVQYGDEDQSSGPRPSVNALAYLTDDYEGGEIYFPELDISIKPKAGSILLFDSDLEHGVNAVKSGVRETLSSNICSIHSNDIEAFKSEGFRIL